MRGEGGGGGCKAEVEKEALRKEYSSQNSISMITLDENEMEEHARYNEEKKSETYRREEDNTKTDLNELGVEMWS